MNYAIGSGVCGKCGQAKVHVEGNPTCLLCDSDNRNKSGLVVTVEDPGEEAMRHLLAEHNVFMPKAGEGSVPPVPAKVISPVQKVVPQSTPVTQNVTFEHEIKRAIDLLQKLPMPKDIKQFKAINRAVKTLESILEVK